MGTLTAKTASDTDGTDALDPGSCNRKSSGFAEGNFRTANRKSEDKKVFEGRIQKRWTSKNSPDFRFSVAQSGNPLRNSS